MKFTTLDTTINSGATINVIERNVRHKLNQRPCSSSESDLNEFVERQELTSPAPPYCPHNTESLYDINYIQYNAYLDGQDIHNTLINNYGIYPHAQRFVRPHDKLLTDSFLDKLMPSL